MKYLAAYMLLSLGGKATPSADDVKRLLSGSGVEVDETELNLMMGKLEGKDLQELMAEGKERLVSIGGGSGGAASAGGAAGGAEAAEEKEKEVVEEADIDVGGGDIFGGDGGDGY